MWFTLFFPGRQRLKKRPITIPTTQTTGHSAYWGPPEGPKAEAFLAARFGGDGAVGRLRAAGLSKDGALVGANPADLMIEALFVGSRRGRRKGQGVGVGGAGKGVGVVPAVVVQRDEEEEEVSHEEGEETKSGDAAAAAGEGGAEPMAAAAAAGPERGGGPNKAAAATARGVSLWAQTAVLSQRMLRDHLRRPWLLACHVAANAYLGVLLGCMYLGAGENVSGIAAIQVCLGI